VRRGGVIGEPLSPAGVRDIVKKCCRLAGLDAGFSAPYVALGLCHRGRPSRFRLVRRWR
jgi:hypothetical protein